MHLAERPKNKTGEASCRANRDSGKNLEQLVQENPKQPRPFRADATVSGKPNFNGLSPDGPHENSARLERISGAN